MLDIETKLSTPFHSQTDGQTEQINQELEQCLQFFIDYRQEDQQEQLAIAKFTVDNKIHSVTKVSLFMANHERELRMGVNIRKRGKVEKATEFAERVRKVQEEVEVTTEKSTEKIK